MKKILIHLVAGARPNFMKIAPLYHLLFTQTWADTKIIHTNQHFSKDMSNNFFDDFSLPKPHHILECNTANEETQKTSIISSYTALCLHEKPDLIIVVGDVTSTLAAATVAHNLKIKLGHVEAGLRSYDETMPEERNRRLTDQLSDILWTPSMDADENLRKENIDESKIYFVGNIMIDAYELVKSRIAEFKHNIGSPYIVVTLHRQENVDDPNILKSILVQLNQLSSKTDIFLPIHHRLKNNIDKFKLNSFLDSRKIHILDPLNYISFISLVINADFVLTDSGGISEETSYLDIPCFTLRKNTERPITVTNGTNTLVRIDDITQLPTLMKNRKHKKYLPLWDGKTADRIVKIIKQNFC